MKNVYFISGLGATKRSFQFLDLSFCNPVFIDWIPAQKKETLVSYAMRLKALIPEENPTIVGLSFGGMLASEMAKVDPLAKVIIISSNKTSDEFPAYLRIGNYLPLYRMIPETLLKKSKHLFQWMLGAEGKEQKAVQLQILAESDIKFTNDAIDMILKWKNNVVAPNIIHIHGTADKLLPYKKVQAHYTVPKGTHLMIMNKGLEISNILKSII